MNELKKLTNINFLTICCSRMPQVSNFQCNVIVLFKKEHPDWGLKQKCQEILPEFFSLSITSNISDFVLF